MFPFKHKPRTIEILKWGIGGGFAESLYIFMVVMSMQAISGKGPDSELLTGILVLTLLVISVVVSAILVFGRPAQLVLKKEIRQAVLTFFTSLVTLIVIFTVVLILTI
jgi:hypothetical protein